jgi:hypothetical protein
MAGLRQTTEGCPKGVSRACGATESNVLGRVPNFGWLRGGLRKVAITRRVMIRDPDAMVGKRCVASHTSGACGGMASPEVRVAHVWRFDRFRQAARELAELGGGHELAISDLCWILLRNGRVPKSTSVTPLV